VNSPDNFFLEFPLYYELVGVYIIQENEIRQT